MLFQVSSQTIVAMQAPINLRGTYFAVFRSTLPIGLAMSPLIGFSTRQAYGDAIMWFVVGLFAVLAVPLALIALRHRPVNPYRPSDTIASPATLDSSRSSDR